MKTSSGRAFRGFPVCVVALLLLADSAAAQVVNAGMFTQNRLRQCTTPTACIGGDPTLQLQADFDAGTAGQVSTLVSSSALGAQAATSGGYTGPAFIPALSAYAYTSGPQRYTLSSFGYQKYTFAVDGTVTFDASLTYSQSGRTAPTSENPRGLLLGSIIKWEFDGDEFDPHACNYFSNVNTGGCSRSYPINWATACVPTPKPCWPSPPATSRRIIRTILPLRRAYMPMRKPISKSYATTRVRM